MKGSVAQSKPSPDAMGVLATPATHVCVYVLNYAYSYFCLYNGRGDAVIVVSSKRLLGETKRVQSVGRMIGG